MTLLEFFWLEFLVLFIPLNIWACCTVGQFLADLYNSRKLNLKALWCILYGSKTDIAEPFNSLNK